MSNLTKTEKIKSMEKESNITLVSITVVIISFFVLLYSQSIVRTNYLRAQSFLTFVDVMYALAAIATTVFAIVKKEKWLWEYAAFSFVMAVGYYFLLKPGVSGIPFLYSETKGSFSISSFALKLSELLKTTHVIYALWAANVVYCILAIACHSVKYNKIKNASVDK